MKPKIDEFREIEIMKSMEFYGEEYRCEECGEEYKAKDVIRTLEEIDYLTAELCVKALYVVRCPECFDVITTGHAVTHNEWAFDKTVSQASQDLLNELEEKEDENLENDGFYFPI